MKSTLKISAMGLILMILVLLSTQLQGCAFMKLAKATQDDNAYRTVFCSGTEMEYNIPASFPNLWDEKEMEGYTGYVLPIGMSLIVAQAYREDGTGSWYALVFSSYTYTLVAASSHNMETEEWKFWIYSGQFPEKCSEEELEAFLIEQDSI